MSEASQKTNQKDTQTIEIKHDKNGKQPKITVLVHSEEALERQVSGFFGFLRANAVVALAVGFVVASQVQNVVKQLLASFIDPMTKLVFGEKLTDQTFTWHFHDRWQNFAWGAFVYVLLDFFIVVFFIYLIIKLFRLDKLDKPAVQKK